MQLTLDSIKLEVRDFRDAEHRFESIEMFINETVLPHLAQISHVRTIRCTLSGLPIAISTDDEIRDCVAAGIRNTKLSRFNDLLNVAYTDKDVADGIEMLCDEVIGQMLTSWRKSPSLTLSRDGMVISAVSKPKQLAMLLNMFLFDGGMFKREFKTVEDDRSRKFRMAALADMIVENWETQQKSLAELLNNLIELDAKYRIVHVKVLRREFKALEQMTFDSIDSIAELSEFVRKMIDWRDDPDHNVTLYAGPRTWTQEALRNNAEYVARRRKFSNMIEDELILVAGKLVKPAKTVEEKVKQTKKQVNFDVIRSIFGINPIGGV
jgi:hypothetical protein